jgi:hypothetical protein
VLGRSLVLQVKRIPMVSWLRLSFLANAFGYLMNYLYFAPKFCQRRVVTVIEAMNMCFGIFNEQVFTWSGMPNSVILAGIWLNGLAIIASGIFGFDMTTTKKGEQNAHLLFS